jgi:hypothetical protein
MTTAAQYRMFAHYNAWANSRAQALQSWTLPGRRMQQNYTSGCREFRLIFRLIY